MHLLEQTVIYLTSIETELADYLVVVTRTACVLYLLQDDGVKRMTSYLINARKKPYRQKHTNRYSYAVRFYFTSAKIVKAEDETEEDDFDGQNLGSAKKVARGGFLSTAELMMLQENESRRSVIEA